MQAIGVKNVVKDFIITTNENITFDCNKQFYLRKKSYSHETTEIYYLVIH